MPELAVVTPIGPVLLTAESGLVASLRIGIDGVRRSDDRLLAEAARQLAAYFKDRLARFDLPFTPAASPRGQALRDAIIAIGPGETRSYGAVARAIESGPRAVGQACARNPLPILVPCHRVVATGGIGHYSGGAGVATKRWLLAHEAGDELWAR